MGFNAKHIEVGLASLKQDSPSLSMNEILLLLNIIKEAKFEGKEVENLYNLIIKLQNMYLSLDELQQQK